MSGITTRGVVDGDDIVINGQKVWISGAHLSEWQMALIKTNIDVEKKHQGISWIIFPTDTPGMTFRPILDVNGFYFLNEVFFDDVRVPKSSVIGEIDKGWSAAMLTTMVFERQRIVRCARGEKEIEDFTKFCQETEYNGEPLIKNPLVRHRIAEMAIEMSVGRLAFFQMMHDQHKGLMSSIMSRTDSAGKIWSEEARQRMFKSMMHILGMYGQLRIDSKYATFMGRIQHNYLASVSQVVLGGSTDVQRNVVSEWGLKLPRIYTPSGTCEIRQR